MKRLVKSIMRLLGSHIGRRRFSREVFYYLAQNFTHVLEASHGRYRYLVNPADRTVGREVFLSGGFDVHWIERTFEWLALMGHVDFRGTYFLDIGANIGTTTVPVVSERGFARAIAMEPEPENFRLLCANIAANGLSSCVDCLNIALSDATGIAEMELCPVNMGDHRLRPRGDIQRDGIYHEASRRTVRVQTAEFDRLVANGVIPISQLGIVWMDTQGFEGHILKCAHSLLQSRVPLVTEFWPYALERSGGLRDFLEIAQKNYQAFVDLRIDPRCSAAARQPIACLSRLIKHYQGSALTDILLLK